MKLFNAIRTQQKVTEVAVQSVTNKSKTLSAVEKAKDGNRSYLCVQFFFKLFYIVATMSKSSFLDLLKTGKK